MDPKDQRIGQLEQTLDALAKERVALRLIVTEKFALGFATRIASAAL